MMLRVSRYNRGVQRNVLAPIRSIGRGSAAPCWPGSRKHETSKRPSLEPPSQLGKPQNHSRELTPRLQTYAPVAFEAESLCCRADLLGC